jgi:CheY-like chemotaxis protein
LHSEVADCNSLIRQAVQVCRSEVLGKELRLELDLAAEHHHIAADPARLQQALWNLLKNAVKFTPEGGSVTIRTRNAADRGAPGARLIVEVSDEGIGIAPEFLPLIFDPFQQGETTVTRDHGGLGLGLAISRGIVEAHGGTLTAESAGRGRGATFRMELRAISEPKAQDNRRPTREVRAAVAGSGRRILLVEDEQATLRLMAWLLRGAGHRVTAAGSISSAMEAVQAGDFDLVISDIGLPDGSGLELMRRAVARRGAVPAIALTGYGMEEDIRRSREAGFTAHLTKPIDFAKLESMIRQVAPTGS